MEYISLGGDCSVAYQLQRHGLKNASYPFDWIQSPFIIPLLELKGEWFQESELVWKKQQAFPLLDEEWKEDAQLLYRVYHKQLKCTFLHDFVSQDKADKVKEKYKKRWARFDSVMKNPLIHKRCFRMGLWEDVELVFQEMNYKNISLYQHEWVSSTSWKRQDWDWKGWFEK
jgi:hypothetical protein